MNLPAPLLKPGFHDHELLPDFIPFDEKRLEPIRRLKVVLLYLPHPYLRQPDAQVPIGILYLAALLEQAHVDVEVRNYSKWNTWQAIEDLPRADVYGITVTSLELKQANRFAHLVKEKIERCVVVLGGPGTFCDSFVDWSVIDSICKGDGEIALFHMLEDYCSGELKKSYALPPVEELNALPLPARHFLGENQGGNVFAFNRQYNGANSTVLITSRGCPYRCAFCSSPFFSNNRVRFRRPENVLEEMESVIKNFGIRQFRFSDDMFLADPKRVFRLCELIGPLGVAWRISTRVKPMNESLYRAMFEAGCKEVSFGVESFDEEVLRALKKGTTPEENARALEVCRRIGLDTRVLFMIGTPGQSERTVPKNIEWLNRVPYTIICCTSFVPIPGSDIWNNPEAYNIEILNRNLDDYNFYFFGSRGENPLRGIVKIKNRSLEEFSAETEDFRNFLKETGKLNEG
ncbi:MAG: radical SAM protein [Desulfobacteraceae bacterium]|nr:MAG: radical SAM protein [Desulfobacteraceae bacterium]